jgi:hypothetical protein
MTATRYDLFADHFQFYLQDDDQSFGDLSAAWIEEATAGLLAVAPHVIGIGTARNMTVPVSVSIHESRPRIREEEWEHITTASLKIDTGRIVVAGCTDYLPDAARIEVAPGVYEAIVCYAKLGSLSADGLKGKDSYHIHLFPGREVVPTVLKGRKSCGPHMAADAKRRGCSQT